LRAPRWFYGTVQGAQVPVAAFRPPVVNLVPVVRPSFRSALVLGAVAAGAFASAVPAASAASTATPGTHISRPVCTTSLDDPQARAATFTVRAARGASATAFGFTATLQEKPAGGKWTSLSGEASPAGLGSFQPAADGAASMVRRINVRGLRMGSAYRLKVAFRWETPGGKQRVTRRSTACTVKELRPNLAVLRSLPRIPGTRGDQVVYRTQIRVKHGRATTLAEKKVTVSVSQGTTLLGRVEPVPLYNGAVVLIPGTVCTSGSDITYRIEVAPAIEESDVADNELTVPCGPARAKRP
jgi:hypothetical protein